MKPASFVAAVLVILISVSFVQPSQAADHAVVLQYHHFGSDSPPSTSVSLETFDRHMKYLKEHDFTIMPLWDIVASLREGRPLPDRTAAITIDDAFISVYTQAFPRLRELGYPFTVFVPTEAVDKGIRGYLTWAQMREMKQNGVTFASHSRTHAHLLRKRAGESDGEWETRVRDDIGSSVRRLEEELGQNPPLFVYPYGEYSSELERIVGDLGLVGVGQQSGPIGPGSDFLALSRFPMGGIYSSMEQFPVKVNTLPLPVNKAEPAEPVLPEGQSRPKLRLTLGPGEYQMETLTCYFRDTKLPITWVDRSKRELEVQTERPLPEGRSRYNCTAHHKTENRYFWYSHLWINNIYHSQDD